MQVVNDVLVESSKMQLVKLLTDIDDSSRVLWEGSRSDGISPPPTQTIADDAFLCHGIWQNLRGGMTDMIGSDSHVYSKILVLRFLDVAAHVLDEQNILTAEYVAEARVHAANVKPYTIDIAGRQRMLQQKIALEALAVRYDGMHGGDTDASWTKLRSSLDLWAGTHWRLLKGDSSENVSMTTSLCIIWQMKYAKDQYDLLEQAVLLVAQGGSAEDALNVEAILPNAFDEMNKAVTYYAYGAEPCTTSWSPTQDEWKQAMIETAHADSLAGKVVIEFLWSKILPVSGDQGGGDLLPLGYDL